MEAGASNDSIVEQVWLGLQLLWIMLSLGPGLSACASTTAMHTVRCVITHCQHVCRRGCSRRW